MNCSMMREPDIITVYYPSSNTQTAAAVKPSSLNIAGYIPGVSALSGLGRIGLGIAFTVNNLAHFIFKENVPVQEDGVKAIGRGFVEIIPFLGNVIMYVVDAERQDKIFQIIDEKIKTDAFYQKHAAVFNNERQIAHRPLNEVLLELEQLKREPSFDDVVRTILN